MAFASRTWDGWDYIPHAWPVWLEASDGVFLVATAGSDESGERPVDAEGQPLEDDQPIAITRVALLSPTEGWVEGIRVDPRVRGLGVATDLQVAELHWLASHTPQLTRYATGARNEGSHRLGARHGFEMVGRFQTWRWKDPDDPDDSNRRDATGFDHATRAEGNRRRRKLLARLSADGDIVPAYASDGWWNRLDGDAGFNAAGRLYERRSWTMQELTRQGFAGHVAAGEVICLEGAGSAALAIVTAEVEPAEDAGIHLAVIAGDGDALVGLASTIQELAGEVIRFRLEANSVSAGLKSSLQAAGFDAWPWELHILARPGEAPLPPVDPARLVLADPPRRTIRPPQ